MTRAYGQRLGTLALVGSVACVVLVGSIVVGVSGPRGTVVALWWLGTAVAMTALVPRLWRWEGPSTTAIAAGAVAALAPALWVGAAASWREPFVHAGMRCGTGDLAMVTLGIPFVAVASVVGALLGAMVARHGRPSLGRWLVALAGLATVAVAGMLVFTASRPSPDAWLSTLPEVARLHFTAAEGEPGATARRDLPDGKVLTRTCAAPDWDGPIHCSVDVGDGILFEAPYEMYPFAADADLVVRSVPSRDWVVVDVVGVGRRMVFDHGAPITVSPDMAGDAVGPPPALVWAWAAGLLLAGFVQGRRWRLARRRRDVAGGREGQSDGESLVFADGQLPARGEPRTPVPQGPVVAIPEVAPGHPSYRDDGATTRWIATAGLRGEQLEVLDRRLLGLDLLSAAVLCVAALPIAVAAATFL